jgi:hypothetical protein
MTAGSWDTSEIISAAPKSPLTCFGFGGIEPRVYFVDLDSHITELAFEAGQWVVQTLFGRTAPGSPLTCLGLGGKDCRLYYVGTNHQLNRLAPDQNGSFQNLVLPGTKVAPGSGLTCTQGSAAGVSAFYVDAVDHLLHVIVSDVPEDPTGVFNEAIDGTAPAPGSALTCFTTDTDDIHVYYLDHQSRINELAWSKKAQKNRVLQATAMPGSALTSFAVADKFARVYYLDSQARVNELGVVHGHWANPVVLGTAARDSALTCYGADGTATRLYYLDAQHRVNELAWQTDHFVNTAL